MPEFVGKFYWPSDEYSTPAENHCWHVPPSPNADFKCIRRAGHPGKHHYEWSPDIKDYSHKHSFFPGSKIMGACQICGRAIEAHHH